MTKILVAIAFMLSPCLANATQTPAQNISANCSTWSKNLNCTMVNQQLVDNAVDQLTTGTPPGGSSGQYQYNNAGVFAGGNILVTNGTNVGIGSTNPGQLLDVAGTARMTGFNLATSPANNYVLTSDASGNGTWKPATGGGGSPGGSNTDVQYNNSGSFAGNSNLTYDGTTLNMIDATVHLTATINAGLSSGTGLQVKNSSNGNAFLVTGLSNTSTKNNTLDDGSGISSFSGNMGIGSTNPGTKLDVTGDIRNSGNITGGGTITLPNGVSNIGTSAGSGSSQINIIGANSASQGAGIYFQRGSTAIANIGTDSNNSPFGSSSNDLAINSHNFNINYYTQGAATPDFKMTNTGNMGIGTFAPSALLEVGARKFDVLSGGNVGVGSISPGQLLDVHGTARMTGFALTGNGAASGNILVSNSVGVGTWLPSSSFPAVGTSGQLIQNKAGSYSGVPNSSVDGTGNIVTNQSISAVTFNGSLSSSQIVNSGFFQSDANTFLSDGAGNVQLNSLEIFSNFNSDSNLINSDGSGNLNVLSLTADSEILNTDDSQSNSDGTVALSLNNFGVATTRFYNVGVISGSSTGGAKIILGDGTNGGVLDFNNYIQLGTSNENDLFFATNDGTGNFSNRLNITGGFSTGTVSVTNANLGIGSISPGYILDVVGGSRIQGQLGINISPSNILDVGGDVTIGFSSPLPTPNNSSLLVKGNIGIGTFNQKNRLDVYGNVGIGTGYAGINLAPVSGLIVQGNVGIGTFSPFGGKLIVSGGNVGIGSLSPGQALDVVGNIRGLTAGSCSFLYRCVGGVDAGVIQTSACNLCPGGTCTQMNGCF